MVEIFETYAIYDGKVITLYEAACILARAMGRMYDCLVLPEGYNYEDLAFSLERNAINAWVNSDLEKEG